MILIFNLCCLILLGCVAFYAIPGEVRQLIDNNCRGSSGRMKLRYVSREFWSIARFYAQFLFAALLLVSIIVFALMIVDSYISLGIVRDTVAQADLDMDQWKRNLKTSPGNVKLHFTNDYAALGGSRSDAREAMIIIWNLVPIGLLLSFTGLVMFLRLVSVSYNNAVRSLAKEESDRDLQRIRRRYLSSTAQAEMNVIQRQAAHPTWTQR